MLGMTPTAGGIHPPDLPVAGFIHLRPASAWIPARPPAAANALISRRRTVRHTRRSSDSADGAREPPVPSPNAERERPRPASSSPDVRARRERDGPVVAEAFLTRAACARSCPRLGLAQPRSPAIRRQRHELAEWGVLITGLAAFWIRSHLSEQCWVTQLLSASADLTPGSRAAERQQVHLILSLCSSTHSFCLVRCL